MTATDLDPRDRTNRLALRTSLRTARETDGISQRELGERLGIDQPGVGRYERADNWRITTALRWARALNRRVVLRPTGFPTAAGRPVNWGTKNSDIQDALRDVLGAMTADGDASDDWTVAKLQSELAGIRVACGITQLRLATRIGVTVQALSLFEGADHGTSVVMAQRHARGIARCAGLPAAYLHLDLEQPEREEEDAAVPTA